MSQTTVNGTDWLKAFIADETAWTRRHAAFAERIDNLSSSEWMEAIVILVILILMVAGKQILKVIEGMGSRSRFGLSAIQMSFRELAYVGALSWGEKTFKFSGALAFISNKIVGYPPQLDNIMMALHSSSLVFLSTFILLAIASVLMMTRLVLVWNEAHK
jgi:hypothetical protein